MAMIYYQLLNLRVMSAMFVQISFMLIHTIQNTRKIFGAMPYGCSSCERQFSFKLLNKTSGKTAVKGTGVRAGKWREAKKEYKASEKTAVKRMGMDTVGYRFCRFEPGFINREQTRSHLWLPRDQLLVGGLRKTSTPIQLCKFFEQSGVVTEGKVISDEMGHPQIPPPNTNCSLVG